MSEYISREAAEKAFCRFCSICKGEHPEKCEFMLDDFGKIPAADVRPVVRGTWIRPQGLILVECSECGKVAPYTAEEKHIEYWPILNYCPNCGADMREVEHD